jgi:ABC-type transporter Mla MlaB component
MRKKLILATILVFTLILAAQRLSRTEQVTIENSDAEKLQRISQDVDRYNYARAIDSLLSIDVQLLDDSLHQNYFELSELLESFNYLFDYDIRLAQLLEHGTSIDEAIEDRRRNLQGQMAEVLVQYGNLAANLYLAYDSYNRQLLFSSETTAKIDAGKIQHYFSNAVFCAALLGDCDRIQAISQAYQDHTTTTFANELQSILKSDMQGHALLQEIVKSARRANVEARLLQIHERLLELKAVEDFELYFVDACDLYLSSKTLIESYQQLDPGDIEDERLIELSLYAALCNTDSRYFAQNVIDTHIAAGYNNELLIDYVRSLLIFQLNYGYDLIPNYLIVSDLPAADYFSSISMDVIRIKEELEINHINSVDYEPSSFILKGSQVDRIEG